MMIVILAVLCLAAISSAQQYRHQYDNQPQYDHQQQYDHSYNQQPRKPIHLITNIYRAQDAYGMYKYGFASTDGVQKDEVRGTDGNVQGSYFYTSPEGQKVEISYTSGKGGFSASGNAIPQAPALPEANVRAIQSHFQALAEAKERARLNPEPQYDEEGNPIYGRGGYNRPCPQGNRYYNPCN